MTASATESDVVGPLSDPVSEGDRIATAAAASLHLKIMGGVAVALRCPSALRPALARAYADIDLVGRRKDSRAITELLAELDYVPDTQFNTLHGARRLLFWDRTNARQLDVFLDTFEMCHKLDLSRRLEVSGATLPLADLLLTKLQVVETNEKDLKDIVAILLDHPISDDDSGVNGSYLASLASRDWGLWKTMTIVAERASRYAMSRDELKERQHVRRQVSDLLGRMSEEPKSRAWRLRDRVGERVRWYELPEEGPA